jgi:hypothetical protein
MADGLTIDASQLHELAAALGEVASSAGPYVRDAMERTAIDVRDDWRAAAGGHRTIRAYPRSIGYDFVGLQSFGSTIIRCDIGPDKGKRQGALGNLLEYGSPTSPPHHWGDQALEAHSEQLQDLLVKALEKAERALTLGGIIRSVAVGRNTVL